MVLESVSLRGELRGLLLNVTLEQRFVNPSKNNLEALYSFPLPWGAVLLGVEIELNGTTLQGQVVEKRCAAARYEEALSDGHSAMMLECNPDNSYTLSLGNLAPKETCVVRLQYAQALPFEQGGLRLLLPTVTAPRYGHFWCCGHVQPYQTTRSDIGANYPFSIELYLFDELASAPVSSPNHRISMQRCDSEQQPCLQISLAQRGALDRDFVLVVQQLPHRSLTVAGYDYLQPERTAVMASFCPQLVSDDQVKVTLKILVDCSGSMAGSSLDAAKRALRSIVAQLSTNDRFSLTRFGGEVEHQSHKLWPGGLAARTEAELWLESLQADMGGTEMERALYATFNHGEAAGDVLLITDGLIHEIDRVLETARCSGHRVFVIGIGNSPAEAHLRRLAHASAGSCDFVAAAEHAEPAIMRMFTRIRSPRVAQLRVQWPEAAQPDWCSALPTALFQGDTHTLFAGFPSYPSGEVRLFGRLLDSNSEQELGCAVLTSPHADQGCVSRLAAMRRVSESGDSLARTLAVQYQLVSAYSNFLLVHERLSAEQFMRMPHLHEVKQMLPDGWGGVGRSEMVDMDMDMDYSSSAAPQKPASNDIQFSRRAAVASQPPVITPPPMVKPKLEPRPCRVPPEALAHYLCSKPLKDWPLTFNELKKLGLDQPVLTWLMRLTKLYGNKQQVITGFLYLLVQKFSDTPVANLLTRTERWRVRLSCGGVLKKAKVVCFIEEKLSDLKPDYWPEFFYESVGSKE